MKEAVNAILHDRDLAKDETRKAAVAAALELLDPKLRKEASTTLEAAVLAVCPVQQSSGFLRTLGEALKGVLKKLTSTDGAALTAANELRAVLLREEGTAAVRQAEDAFSIPPRTGAGAPNRRAALGQWFDDSMARASGAYKRNTQIIVFCLGCVLVGALNVDTIAITRMLWTQPELRKAVAEQASRYIADAVDAGTPVTDGGTFEQKLGEANAHLKTATTKLEALSLPLGWVATDPKKTADRCLWSMCLRDTESIWSKLLGLFLSVIAISLGAPFWFDTLSKLANVRSAGAKPAAKDDTKPA